MRKIYRNFINQEDVDNENLLGIGQGMFHVLKSPENCLAYKVIDAIKEDFDFTVKKESYLKVGMTVTNGIETLVQVII